MVRNKVVSIVGRVEHTEAEALYLHLANTRPHIFKEAHSELKEILPEFIFSDFALIPEILKDFCAFRGIEPKDIIGNAITLKAHDYRKEFLAVLLLCYHPEKLHNITQKRTWQGIQKIASKTLDCRRASLANFIPIVVEWFNRYPSIRNVVVEAHAYIVNKYSSDSKIKVRKYSILAAAE